MNDLTRTALSVSALAAGLGILAVALPRNSALPTVTRAHVPAGHFLMGCGDECPMEDAKPVHRVEMGEFWMDVTPVTNAQFASFVRSTHYQTLAERTPLASDYPEAPKENLLAGSAVFFAADVSLGNPYAWWKFVPGAYWRHPEGPQSADAVATRPTHPVVHVAYQDAIAYCRWAGGDLPTEAQYEYAARGGLERKKYAWGDELKPGGKWVANIWQGKFPTEDRGEDGYRGTSPVDAFPPNGYGLHDMGGNVWQWCKDWYRADTYVEQVSQQLGTGKPTRDPQGPAISDDPSEPGVSKRVQRGGSFLCSDQYCVRYLVGSRGRGAPDNSASNLGFRCVSNRR